MQLHDRELALHLEGEDVKLLHTELQQLGFELDEVEVGKGIFGPKTEEAVKKFQKTHGIEPSGVVDEKTAELINHEVKETQPVTAGPFIVKGRIVDPDGKSVPDSPVRAFDRDLRSEELLGETVTDKGGYYEIRYSARQFRKAEKQSADVVIHVYNTDGREIASSPIYFNVGPEVTIDLIVGDEVYRRPSEYEQLVADLIPLLQGLGFTDLTEDDKHQDITFLSGETGWNSQYIAFLSIAHRLQQQTRLAAEVYYGLFREGLPTQLPELLVQHPGTWRRALLSAVKNNIIPDAFAGQIDTILDQLNRLIAKEVLDAPAKPDKATLSQLIGTVLRERKEREAFLSAYLNHTGAIAEFWEGLAAKPEFRGRIGDLQLSLQLGALTNNHLPLVRELQRGKQAERLNTGQREIAFHAFQDLVQLDELDWLRILEQEGEHGVIGIPEGVPGRDDAEKKRIYARAMTHMVEDAFPMPFLALRLEADDLPGRSDLLAFFHDNPEFNLRATRLDGFIGSKPDAFSRVADVDGTRTRIKAMQRVYRLAPRYTQMSGLLKGGVDSAYRITRMGRRQFTARYGEMLGGVQQAIRIYEDAEQVNGTAIALLADYGPMFGRVTMPVLPDESVPEVEGIPEWSTLFGSLELCGCEHCRSVNSPAAYYVDVLHFLKDRPCGIGPGSAKHVLFARRPDLGEIELTCENTNTVLPYVDLVNEVLENAVAPPPREFEPIELDDALETDLNDRFLSDALRDAFNPQLSTEAVITVGGRGRPWLTSEPWWTIDDPAHTYTIRQEDGVLRVVSRSRQTKGTAAELAANPQYVNSPAYDVLGQGVYPWALPFNLWDEEARAYLGHLGVERHQIMETFLAGERQDILDRFDVACAHLGLTIDEARIITGDTDRDPNAESPGVWNLWGFETPTLDVTHSIPEPADSTQRIASGRWLEVLGGRVDVFLQQSSLSYRELLELLDTYYVNPADDDGVRSIWIVSSDSDNPATCETHLLRLDGLDEAAALRAMRFVRLGRKLGWTMRDLDRAITTFGNEDLSSDFLVRLSHVQRLHAELKVPIVRLLALWSSIDTACYIDHGASGQPQLPSLYAQLFRNKAVINPPDPNFTEDPDIISGFLTEHMTSITAALRISAADFDCLFNDQNVIRWVADPSDPANTIPDDSLTLENLSCLFRHTVMAKALRLPINDYLTALNLVNGNPFASTMDTVLFVEKIGKVRNSGFIFAQLDYLLRHAFTPTSGVAPSEEATALVLGEIRSGLQTIAAENIFTDDPRDPGGMTTDPKGDLTRQKLALLNWDNGLIEQTVALLNDGTTFEAALAVMAPGIDPEVDFPESIRAAIAYDEAAGRLRITRAMTLEEGNLLQGILGADVAFREAVQALFDAPRRFVTRYLRRFSVPNFSTELTALPADEADPTKNIEFPKVIRDKAYFDSVAGLLHFIGVMTEQERDALLALSTDVAYQAAVTRLFGLPDTQVPEAGDAFLTASDSAALFDEAVTPEDRFLHLLQKLLPHLRQRLSERLVAQKLAEVFKLETRVAEALLTSWVTSPADSGRLAPDELLDPGFAESNQNIEPTPLAFPAQFRTYTRLHKIAALAAGFELTAAQLAWLFEYGPGVGWLDLNTLPTDAEESTASFEDWLRLVDLCELRDGLPMGEETLGGIFLLARQAGVSREDLVQRLSERTQWNGSDLEFLIGTNGFNLALPDAFLDERALMRLRACFALLKRLGMSASQCRQLARETVDLEGARYAKGAVRAKYEEDQWLVIAKPLRDVLREKQRAALVAYLVTHFTLPAERAVRDANDLFSHFLIDVEMSHCMLTSRIKQAISSTQLFVQRCLMNLEPEVLASIEFDEKWRQWKWMKNYRVWEANRKVFLYPENWIEPELRDDKSPFFKELESELLQSDLTLESAQEAFGHYLEKLDQVARLEIVGMYHQVERTTATGPYTVDLLHVFGRTYGEPRLYYYRQRVDSDYWTPWERIDLDIVGDHLLPVVWNGRLYLFWPIFAEKAEEYQATMPDTGTAFSQPVKYWEIKLAWSERKQGKWTTKKVSSESQCLRFNKMYAHWPSDIIDLEDQSAFLWRSWVDTDNSLWIATNFTELATRPWPDWPVHDNTFFFGDSNAEPRVDSEWKLTEILTGTEIDRMFLKEAGSADGKLYLPTLTNSPVLARTPGTFLLLPHHDGSSLTRHPCFYIDDTRTFFVFPTTEIIREPNLPIYVPTMVQELVPDISEKYYMEFNPIVEPVGPYCVDPRDPAPYEISFPVSTDLRAVTTLDVGELIDEEPSLRADLSVLASAGINLANRPNMGLLRESRPVMLLFGHRSSSIGWRSAEISAPGGSLLPFLFHGGAELDVLTRDDSLATAPPFESSSRFCYRFQTYYHPYVSTFVHEFNRDGLDGLLQRQIQLQPEVFSPRRSITDPTPEPLDFKVEYGPEDVDPVMVHSTYPEENVEFEYGEAYSIYNWELFFHAPLMIADRLNKNQRFEEAQKWFHFIFDPTDTSSLGVPERFWRTKPFHERDREGYRLERIQDILTLLAAAVDPQTRAQLSEEQEKDLEQIRKSIEQWRKDPFKPHLIARLRTTAYEKTVVMKYIDNLIAWGDQLFRRDTIESINEATQLYVLAAEILGRRPEDVPPRATPRVQTYNSLEPRLDDFSNALVKIEEFIPPSAEPGVRHSGEHPPVTLPMLYFCIAKNDKLLSKWDTVADRLFKIRHCMNIEGVVRQLPLFEPPIEPGLLVKAAAAGVDLSSVLNDINAALPHYRFNIFAQKAAELCAELKSLGSALLSALEKQDAEELALIRARHEMAMLELVKEVKQKQYNEAVQNEEALRKSRVLAESRYLNYQKLLGVQEPKVPDQGEAVQVEPDSPHVTIEEEGGVKMIPHEKAEMQRLTDSHDDQEKASKMEFLASIWHATGNVNISPLGVGISVGGSMVGSALTAVANYYRGESAKHTYQGTEAAKLGQYAMRAHDWALQSNLAAKEIEQIDQQIVAAEIRKAIADQEKKNHATQIENAQEVEAFLKEKYTNQDLYGWMIGQIAAVYFQTYQLAYDVAKRAEAAYRFELALKDSSFIKFGYWDGLKKGLLAGEKLHHDLKRMEMAHLDQNKREYEITKHVSLMQLDPLALIRLKETGECSVILPEALFDFDCPGHYMRRIKSVGVSIPCVTGPYTSVNCTMTLLKSSIRHANTLLGGNYVRDLENEDPRFIDNFAGIQSIVTSSSQNDSGLFEVNLRDERYLPFEGTGLISEWRLELPAELRQFDYETISDVIIHIRYTAREGGESLRGGAIDNLNTCIEQAQAVGSVRLLSIRHEFPTEWGRFKGVEIGPGTPVAPLTIELREEHYPFWSYGRLEAIRRVDFFVKTEEDPVEIYDSVDENGAPAGNNDTLVSDPSLGELRAGSLTNIPLPPPIGSFTLYFDDNSMEELWLALTWGKAD